MEIRRSCSPEVGWMREEILGKSGYSQWPWRRLPISSSSRKRARRHLAGKANKRLWKGEGAKPKASRTEQFYACRSFIPAGVQNLELQAGGEAVDLLDCLWKTLNVAASTKWELACRLARLWAVRAVFHLRLFGGYRLGKSRAYACRRRR